MPTTVLCPGKGADRQVEKALRETGTNVTEALLREAVFLSFLLLPLKKTKQNNSAKSNLKENRFILAHSLRVQSDGKGSQKRWEFEAAGHMATTVGKQRWMSVRCCPVPFLC